MTPKLLIKVYNLATENNTKPMDVQRFIAAQSLVDSVQTMEWREQKQSYIQRKKSGLVKSKK